MAEPRGKGISKHWAPRAEEYYAKILVGCNTFAQRHIVMLTRDILKYDGRTKAAKRAIAQARLRLVTATDEDLQQIAELAFFLGGSNRLDTVPERVKELKEIQARIREKGIKRSELECP